MYKNIRTIPKLYNTLKKLPVLCSVKTLKNGSNWNLLYTCNLNTSKYSESSPHKTSFGRKNLFGVIETSVLTEIECINKSQKNKSRDINTDSIIPL
jgi:hypothetical protein